MITKSIAALVLLVFTSQLPLSAADNEPVVLEDFDGNEGLGGNWTAFGEIEVRRVDVPRGERHEGVQGKLVAIRAESGSTFAVRSTFPRPDYESAIAIRFRMRAVSADEDANQSVEFQAYATDRRAWFWRKVTFVSDEWKTVEVPLRFCRQSPGAALDWREVHRMAFFFRDSGEYLVDRIELVPGDREHPAYLSPAEVGQIAFGDDALTFQSEQLFVLTDDERLEGNRVIEALEKVQAMIAADFPDWSQPQRPVMLLVFAHERDYRSFWRTFAGNFNSNAEAPASDGYTVSGVSGSYFSDKFGAVRPVYVHEFCHSLLAQALGLSNLSEWLHEGLASHYQLRWTNEDARSLLADRIERGRLIPLQRLTDGRPIATDAYADAALFIEWMLTDPERKADFARAVQEMRKSTNTNLAEVVEPVFGMTLEELNDAYLRWASGDR